MKPLILVKHSMPEIVENAPAREWNLSEEGRRRAKLLADELRKYKPEVLISSVEPKARQTAEIVGNELSLDFSVIEGLHEHDRSAFPYYSSAEFQNLVRKFFEKPDALVFGNETANQSLARFCQVVESVVDLYNDKIVVIVAHGTVISLYVSHLTEVDGYDLWKDLGLPSYVLVDMKSKSFEIWNAKSPNFAQKSETSDSVDNIFEDER